MQPKNKKSISTKKVARQAERRLKLRNGIISGSLAFAAIIAIFLMFNAREQGKQQIEGVTEYTALSRDHVSETVSYDQTPPVGGAHNPVWQNCGVYTETIANENGVHSLEHGAVWITYRPDLPDLEVRTLQALTRQSGFRLLSPYPDLPSPIVISAWGYQLQVEQADDPRIKDFIEQYELSPQGPEPGAPCTGGVGQPG
ncbi:MAG: DUF3105 domain-containing protein [Anaerolineales bacterium]|jgi:hypothetical protein|nr:DUF3105 domain-containing protein [Chloroflexota bacterium]MBN8658275.1 DUF3105 domain-containing protein [Anaerolineae bacterium]MBX3037455.1 DUF3105 domain-containing protein [Anaerolineales bacterium]RJP47052.1 MAG: DUF3105 domain-containing protein [Anaerolineaceae bacterium]MBI5705003.1 DUF3105 domain-containing protein [Chloroflexota bacterium]